MTFIKIYVCIPSKNGVSTQFIGQNNLRGKVPNSFVVSKNNEKNFLRISFISPGDRNKVDLSHQNIYDGGTRANCLAKPIYISN